MAEYLPGWGEFMEEAMPLFFICEQSFHHQYWV